MGWWGSLGYTWVAACRFWNCACTIDGTDAKNHDPRVGGWLHGSSGASLRLCTTVFRCIPTRLASLKHPRRHLL
ncbi:hypothetical protein DFP72DRAFT_582211 [Ephemerocybe angulata]|uniref:Secreted protein n=1 Tax=Ephemerocybe angulata TaxID=980116 RepID=A0A8H6HKN4_9AGAR|nr:hypothetical protein DFP72DRAFT_582211 [Tulosesus angulatus]